MCPSNINKLNIKIKMFSIKKLLISSLFLFTCFESHSTEITISCIWKEKNIFNEKKIKIKSLKLFEKEFFYLNTNFEFFGNPRNYGSLSDPNNEFNQNDFFEYKNNTFFKLSDFSSGKRTHYFVTQYDRNTGKITDKFVNLNPNYGKVQSTEKIGSCKEVVFETCEDEKVLICSGNYINYNKITDETIKYKQEKKYFLCEKKRIISEKPFFEYQRTYPDYLDINEYKETNSSYIVKLYNADGYDFHIIKLEKNNLDIKESIDLNRIKTEFNAKCKF